MTSASKSTSTSSHLVRFHQSHQNLVPTKRLPHPRIQEINGLRKEVGDPRGVHSHAHGFGGNPSHDPGASKRALPQPKCRCSGTGVYPPISSFRSKSLLVNRPKSLGAQPNYLLPALHKVVTFNLPPTYRTSSAPPLLRSRSISSLNYLQEPPGTAEYPEDGSYLRRSRNLPVTPFNKHPLSPTMPMAKLKLYREIFGNNNNNDPLLRRKKKPAPIPQMSVDSGIGYRGSLPGSPVLSRSYRASLGAFDSYSSNPEISYLATPTRASGYGFPSMTEVTRPPCLDPSFYHMNKYDYETYYRQRRGDLQPFYQSAPPTRPSTPPHLTKYSDSPREQFKNQLKFFVEERKGALGLNTGLGRQCGLGTGYHSNHEYQPQRGSESDLNALLHLYSHVPDPVLDSYPPPGAPTYQGIPQMYVLRRNASYPSIGSLSPMGTFSSDYNPRPPSPYPKSLEYESLAMPYSYSTSRQVYY